MWPLSASLSVARLAAVVAASLLTCNAAGAQSPPAAAPSSDGAQAGQPSVAMPAPGYNPGEMLKDLANPVVAEVEGHPITLADVGDAIRALPAGMRDIPFEDLYPGVLDRLIQEQALVMKARRQKLDLDPAVKRHMQAAADRVLENELLNRLLGAGITEQALLARYQTEFADKPGPEEADVRVILLPTEDQARKVIAELGNGADFASVARRDSKDASAAQGGSLGFLRQDKLTPEIGAAAFVLEPGQVSPNPVRSRTGWFVVRVEARRRVPQPGFAEVREQLRHELLQEGIARIAQEALAGVTVRKFNMNGTAAAGSEDEQPGSGGGKR
jgi:peptidyl-prolyl cis-trans isomerase C